MKKFFSRGFKNLSSEFWTWFWGVILLVPIVLIVIGLVLYIPIDYIKYKRSFYYKQLGEKYSLYKGNNLDVVFYNTVLKNNLPIQYIPTTEVSDREFGWFVYGNTLIIPSCFSFCFNDDKKQWVYENEDQIYMTLDEYIKIEMADLNKLLGKAGCDKAVVLINRHDVSNEELARNDEKFLVYGKNMEEVICAFCAS